MTALELDPFEHDALMIDRALWPEDRAPLPNYGEPDPNAICEARDCYATADPRAVAVTSYSCLEHMPADVLEEITR